MRPVRGQVTSTFARSKGRALTVLVVGGFLHASAGSWACGSDEADGGSGASGGSGGDASGGVGGVAGSDSAVDSGAPLSCGDAKLDDGEQCDDGNTDDSDGCTALCRFTCEVDVDCSDAAFCNGPEVCTAEHRCTPGTPLEDGASCGFAHLCQGGRCEPIESGCGDGRIESGEECDDGNREPRDGCEPDCRFTCLATDRARDCRAANACQEDGVCNATTHTCEPRNKANGTICGPDLNCVEGNCVPVRCIDGIVAQGVEECDDGNNRDTDGCGNDCLFSCRSALADCPPAQNCRLPTCLAHICAAVPDNGEDGKACDTGAGAAVCANGACTTGQCGDGVLQTGEECDFGASQNRIGSGCEPLCLTSCHSDAECNDNDPCNGVERCETVSVGGRDGRRCTPPAPRPDGTDCGGGKLCVAGSCRTSFCGDRVTDIARAEECDPPNTVACDGECLARRPCQLSGRWAVNFGINVDLTGPALEPSSGIARIWTLLSLQQDALDLTGTLRPCGLSVPDLQTVPAVGSEIYGPLFPNALFDSALISTAPLTATTSGLAVGATVSSSPASILLGVSLDDRFGAWPDLAALRAGTGASIQDHDSDGKPGVSLQAKTGPLPGGNGYYTYTIVNVDDPSNPGRADRLYIVMRTVLALQANTVTCDEMTGSATVSSIDLHIVGCRRLETGADCTPTETELVDATRPIFAPKSATLLARRVADDASCTQVRAAVP